MKNVIFVLAVLLIMALISRYDDRQYDAQCRDLKLGHEEVTMVVLPGEGIDVLMNRALGEDKDKYLLEVKRDVFRELNGNKMLHAWQKVTVRGHRKIEMAQN